MLVSDQTIDGTSIDTLKPCSEKRIQLRCDECGTITVTTYANYRNVQKQRGNSGITFCRLCALRKSAKKRCGSVPWNKGKAGPSGPAAACWHGGEHIDHYGYKVCYVPNSSGVGRGHYEKEHVLAMERFLGRNLERGEVVHHIDGDKLNNGLENLYLMENGGHTRTHQTLQHIGYQLVRAGLVYFDHETSSYMAGDKLRELLEHPGEGNQQPSRGSDPAEGSTTRRESLRDDNSPTSAEHAIVSVA